MEPSGSGAKPVEEEDLIQEPGHGRSNSNSNASSPSNGAPSAAVPPPPRATPPHLERPRREQAGGGADGSTSAAAGVYRKGKGTLPPPPNVVPSLLSSSGSSRSSTPSLDHAAASTAARGGESSCAVGGSKARVTWSDPVAAETREVPDAAAHPFDRKLVSRQRLVKEQATVDKEKSRWEQQSLDQPCRLWFDSQKNRGYSDGSSSSSTGFNRKGKGMLPPKVIPCPPSSAGNSSSSTPSLDYATTLKAGAFGGGESSSAVGGSKGRVMWSDPVAAETREVPNAAAYSFDPKLVSRQRMVKEQGAVDKEKGLGEQQSVKQPSKRHFDSRRPNEVAVNWSGSDDDGTPCPLYVEFCGDGSRLTPKREWSDVRVVRKLRGLRPQEKFAARNHFRGLRDSQQAGGRRPTPLFVRAMDNLRDGKLAEQRTRDSDIPEYLTCPLSGQVMIDPVTIATGKTFDRRFVKDWFEKKGLVCPLTGEHVSGAIVRNERIRGYVKEWNESKAEVITKVGKKRT